MSDSIIFDDVSEELRFNPKVDSVHIGVSVRAGVVMLSGHVGSFAEKAAAIMAARRVKGVTAVSDELEVLFPQDRATADEDIAQRSFDVLRWDAMLPPTIHVTVRHGLVMLTGQVEWRYQSVLAEENVRALKGVKGVVNNIVVAPTVAAADVKGQIEKALLRYADVEAKSVQVKIQNGSHVILEGVVRHWSELAAIETAAWSVKGVRSVDNKLAVRPATPQLA